MHHKGFISPTGMKEMAAEMEAQQKAAASGQKPASGAGSMAGMPGMQMPGVKPAADLPQPGGKADFTVHIAQVVVELAREVAISTVGYNGISPGPLLRMREGARTVVDVLNDTDVAEVVHWHGMTVPSAV